MTHESGHTNKITGGYPIWKMILIVLGILLLGGLLIYVDHLIGINPILL